MIVITAILSLFLVVGCGVKGNPLPPIEPPQIGHGTPAFQRASRGIKIKSKKTKGTTAEDDWDDSSDFQEPGSE